MPAIAPGRGGAFPPDAQDERREVARHGERERPADHGENIRRSCCGESSRRHGDKEQQHTGDREPADRRRVRIDHLVVDVVAERVGDGEQESVGGGERRREAAGRDQARDHVRKARDLRRGEHDHVRVDHEVLEPQHARMVGDRLAGRENRIETRGILAADLDQPKLTPREQPWTDGAEIAADDVGVDLKLRERRIGRRREVQEEDEQQRPGD